MLYEIVINGEVLAIVGHDNILSMNLSLSVSGEDDKGRYVFASAVCEENGERYFYNWLQHPISADDYVEFRPVLQGEVMQPWKKRKMEPQGE